MQTLERATSSRKRLVIAVLAVVTAVVTGVLVWFQPQKLFIDERVDEAAPAKLAQSETSTGPADPLSGAFSSLAHETTGKAIVRTTGDGERFLRLEDFVTSNGPDVRVYLSAGDEDSYGKDFVDLGGLKGNEGNQNYRIPDGTDLEKYDTAVIWCRRFTVAFGAAQLA
jgi:hypothetical protein